MDGSGTKTVFSSLRGPLRAIGSVVLPTPEALDEEGWQRAETIMEHALASRPEGVKQQLRLFLRLVNVLPLLTTGRTLEKLPLQRRAAFLERLQRSPLMPIRRGLWGVRTLIFMGYYNQKSVREGIGYRADPWGWTDYYGDKPEENPALEHPSNSDEGDIFL
jgi:hypothetical protein